MYHAPVHLELGRQLQNVRTIYRGGLKARENHGSTASDPVSWNRYLILIKAYTAIEVVVMAMVIYTLMY
jgi:hypothetical protein